MTQPTRFLVVDDNLEFAQNLCELLSLNGYEGVAAADAEQALSLLMRHSFHGVFTDLRLPGQSGVELIEEVRRRGLPVPMVLMTAFPEETQVVRARHAGALEVLAKPVTAEHWLAVASQIGCLQP